MNNNQIRGRGRPRQFDTDEVLDRALRLFWVHGLAGTSLDDLAGVMDLNRPSLKNAFGDKESIYRLVFARFVARMRAEMGSLLFGEPGLKKALGLFFNGAIRTYCAAKPALGCFALCTAPLEASTHPDVRSDLKQLIDELDGLLAERFDKAKEVGQFPVAANSRAAAKLVQSILHSLALRARAGESRDSLRKLAQHAVDVICLKSR